MVNRAVCLLATAIAFVGASLSTVAHADGVGVDEINLKNGGMLRGTIIALEPDKQVVVLLAPTSESRTIPWAEINKIDRGKYAPAPAPAPAPVSTAPASAASAVSVAPSGPRIHIETDHPGVALERVGEALRITTFEGISYAVGVTDETAVANEVRCSAPCDKVINAHSGDFFRFAGDGLNPSERFQLDNHHGDVTARVSAVGSSRMGAGLGLFMGSLFAGFASGIVISSSLPEKASDTQIAEPVSVGGVATGIGLSGVSVAALIAGIYFVATSKTTYTLHPKGSHSSTASPTIRISGTTLLF